MSRGLCWLVAASALLVTGVCAEIPTEELVLQEVHESDFKAFTTHHPKFLALLYAPWDSVCKKALQDFSAAAHATAKIFEEQGKEKLVFVTVDCSKSNRLCQRFGCEGFPPPRLGIFNLTNPVVQEKVVLSDVKPQVYSQHFYESIALTLEDDASDFTQNFERMDVGPHHIKHLDVSSIDSYKEAHETSALLVVYYSNACSHSGNFLPHFAAQSNEADALGLNVKFASVNCGRPGNNQYCSLAGVNRYPSVLYLSPSDADGNRSGEGSGTLLPEATPDTNLLDFLQAKGISASNDALPAQATEL